MHHGAGVAVAVDHKIVHHKIAQYLVYVQSVLHSFACVKRFQRPDEPGLVCAGHIGFGAVEDVGIAVRIVIRILQLHVAGAHAAEAAPRPAAKPFPGIKPSLGRVSASARFRKLAAEGGWSKVLRRSSLLFRRLRTAGRTVSLLPVVTVHKLVHVEVPAVSPAPAEAHTVRLVQLAVIPAVIALKEGVLHPLHRQIQSPVLPVYGEVHITAQRRLRPKLPHHAVGEVILHHGVVLDEIVQAQLIQTVVALALVIMVKFQLEAVAVAAHLGHRGQRGVPLRPNANALIRLVVNDHCAQGVLLILTDFNKLLPVVHHNVDGMYLGRVKQLRLITHHPGGGLDAQGLAVHKQQGEQ